MLTRSRAVAARQPIFVDDQWSDAYIQAKDEQIDAQQQAAGAGGWSDSEGSGSEGDDGDDDDGWRSDDEDSGSDDDDDDADDGDVDSGEQQQRTGERSAQSRVAGGGFAENVWWTLLSVLVAPLLLYAAALKRHDTPWPLRSASLGGMLVKVLANLLALGALALVSYGAACSERVPSALHALLWRHLEIRGATECRAAFAGGWQACVAPESGAQPPCAHALAQGSVLATALVLACAFHRRWLKALLLLVLGGYAALNAAVELQAEQRAAVKIFALDPSFAFANESIFVAIDGQNLAQGGVVAWVPFWGGLHERKAHKCLKLFPERLSSGGVLVTFDAVNEYVPCYAASVRESASAAEASAAFQCFEGIRLRVKDHKSVPGWSLQARERGEEL